MKQNDMNRRDWMLVAAGVVASNPGLGQAPGWSPRLFDAHQNETVIALTEAILPATDTPGAKAAQVNRYLDLLLADGPAAERHRFLEGLAFLDSYAIRTFQTPFVRCSAEQQTAILTAFEENKAGDLETGNRFFRLAKQLTARIYYATEIGFRELNKGGRVPASYACKHPEHQS
ncbi:MAG: gluconate 2-dehydrogenase subunit 3 family protein [Bryobacteraceae bacterium]|nr:gluconate 2-dehydrogenase subunit 3 family protein [Bryobacteraceae bacterium]MDW8379371.1 gluconate 2-dehydrogenase subunit 3 family protein [Bryobacterales bacterium]